ncbi:MAG: class I SAM-dependent methyltransferase [Acidimicrobiia bacterium]|nr:class I SAM-dependent methyltransferase [Acidimicrobiia bacterium]
MGEESRSVRNARLWAEVNAQHTDADAASRWATPSIEWGLFDIPEADVGVIGDVSGLDVVELGCGTAYFSAWLARAGARPVGVDLSRPQLSTARRCQTLLGLAFPLVEADAERLPLQPNSFDLAVSEYGACLWCDPELWLAEAARVLRPGGRLVFLTNSPLAGMCVPADGGYAGTELLRPQRALCPVTWPDGNEEFHPGHGDWIRLLGDNGFAVDALVELYAPPGSRTHPYYEVVTAEWASAWPAEDLWVAHLR